MQYNAEEMARNAEDWRKRTGGEYGKMTVLDYFAGQALVGLLASPDCTNSSDELAKAVWLHAKNVLKARGDAS